MGKPLEVSDMPPLTREIHKELRQLETLLNRDLLSCCGEYHLADPHAAFEYTRTAATEFFDCFYRFYSENPDPQYREHCRPASERFAFGRIVKCLEDISSVEDYFKRNQDRVDRIKRTISDHAQKVAPLAHVLLPIESPQLPNVWAKSEHSNPPIALQRYQPAAVDSERRKLIQPLLDSKGWSLVEWADDAKVAYHTVADYMAGKRKQYASTRKKLAESLGLSIQQLPK
jgi:hypothetical protein